jgi:SAM-dependent methyltransferase
VGVREDNVGRATFGPEAWEPLALGLRAYQEGDRNAVLVVHADDGEAETMPVSAFFRSRPEDLREVDREALDRVRGRTLDGGAGVGSMSLLLQDRGVEVTAVEVIPEAVEIMGERGVMNPLLGRLEDVSGEQPFDTILLLMNGTALAGTLAGLPSLLETLSRLLAPGGQVLLDSTDLGGIEELDDGPDYPGELQYQLEFQGERGAPFPQLFVDPETLARVAGGEGWRTEILCREEGGEYLARLTREL